MNIQTRIKSVEDKMESFAEETVLFALAGNDGSLLHEIPSNFDKENGTIFVIDSSFQQLDKLK